MWPMRNTRKVGCGVATFPDALKFLICIAISKLEVVSQGDVRKDFLTKNEAMWAVGDYPPLCYEFAYWRGCWLVSPFLVITTASDARPVVDSIMASWRTDVGIRWCSSKTHPLQDVQMADSWRRSPCGWWILAHPLDVFWDVGFDVLLLFDKRHALEDRKRVDLKNIDVSESVVQSLQFEGSWGAAFEVTGRASPVSSRSPCCWWSSSSRCCGGKDH